MRMRDPEEVGWRHCFCHGRLEAGVANDQIEKQTGRFLEKSNDRLNFELVENEVASVQKSGRWQQQVTAWFAQLVGVSVGPASFSQRLRAAV